MKLPEAKRHSNSERRLLIGMITDSKLLALIVPHWGKGTLRSRWADTLGGWCVEHYARHRTAPGKAVEGYYSMWADTQEARGDRESQELIGRLLASLSADYTADPGSAATVEEAEHVLSEARLKGVRDRFAAAMEAGDNARADEILSSYRPLELGGASHFDSMGGDVSAAHLLAALPEDDSQPLLEFHGDRGKFYRRSMDRGGFIVYNGLQKVGKSWFIMDLAWAATLQRRKVALFDCGDMTTKQVIRRLACRAARRPLYSGSVQYPLCGVVDEAANGNRLMSVSHETRTWDADLNWQEALEAFRLIQDRHVRDDVGYLRMQHYAGDATAASLQGQLEAWAASGWVADVVVIDYADLLQPSVRVFNKIDGIDDTYRRLRAMASKLDCLVVTASQAKMSANGKYRMSPEDTGSYDCRKIAHVTGNIAVNQIRTEARRQCFRLDWLHSRDGCDGTLYTAGCLGIGDPAVLTAYESL